MLEGHKYPLVSRLAPTDVKANALLCEGQRIVVRVDALMKVFCIRFVTYKELLERC